MYALLQYGYGLTTPGGIYGFAHRILLTNTLRNPTYLAVTDEGYQDVFVFDATDQNTGLQGDSGGPVYALTPDGTQSFLVGLHLGANYYPDRTDDDPASPTTNNAITVLSTERVPRIG